MHNYYFTFGSDSKYPFPNGYLIVKAETEREACDLFSKKYANRDGYVNCAFIYSERDWKGGVADHYKNISPSDVISATEEADLDEFLSCLSDAKRTELYHKLQAEYVKDDVLEYCEDNGIDPTTINVDAVVYRYVYDGDYDCNQPYWDNIGALVRFFSKVK